MKWGMITSLLDTDLYKLTMMQAVFHQFPGETVEYQFKCRNKDVDLSPYASHIQERIDEFCMLQFTDEELDYLSKLRFMKPGFIQLLRMFKPDSRFVKVEVDETACSGASLMNAALNDAPVKHELKIKVAGPWLQTILFEVPILAIVNETYFNMTVPGGRERAHVLLEGRERLKEKIRIAQDYRRELSHLEEDERDYHDRYMPFLITDFGTRRRFSGHWQDEVVKTLKDELQGSFVGTSNVYLAMKYGITPIGTMAHEWLQAPQGVKGVQLAASQQYALQKWADEYRGDLGIALSDVVGFDAFLRDFDLYFAKLFDGCRHDSGDPSEWCARLIDHYGSLGIEPETKRAVFSDGLTIPKAIELHRKFGKRIQMGFGIGTNLTNDLGPEPLQIVMKLTKVNGNPVAKVSDARGKTMCENENFLRYLKDQFKIKD